MEHVQPDGSCNQSPLLHAQPMEHHRRGHHMKDGPLPPQECDIHPVHHEVACSLEASEAQSYCGTMPPTSYPRTLSSVVTNKFLYMIYWGRYYVQSI